MLRMTASISFRRVSVAKPHQLSVQIGRGLSAEPGRTRFGADVAVARAARGDTAHRRAAGDDRGRFARIGTRRAWQIGVIRGKVAHIGVGQIRGQRLPSPSSAALPS